MKKILLFLAFTISSAAQDRYFDTDFYVQEKTMEWSHVYESQLNTENLIIDFQKNVISTFVVENFQNIDNSISFTIANDKIDVTKYGETNWSTDMYVTYPLYYFVRVDFKDFRYKVTISQIESICPYPKTVWKYTELLDKNFKIKDGKRWKRSFTVVNDYFKERFLIKQKSDDKW